jgi:hypothetical protein
MTHEQHRDMVRASLVASECRQSGREAPARRRCFLAPFAPEKPCDGRLIRAHLIPVHLLKREVRQAWAAANDPRSWVWACGGPMGNAGHHGMLDASRTLRIPRDRLPRGLEALAEDLGLGWWLDREYGVRCSAENPMHDDGD